MKLHRSAAEITASGLDKQIGKIEEQGGKFLDHAADVLAPLEISRTHVEALLGLQQKQGHYPPVAAIEE